MEKLFINREKEEIVIKITKNTIYFNYKSDIENPLNHTNKLHKDDSLLLSEEDYDLMCFYCIDNGLWINNYNSKTEESGHDWQYHMLEKRWYTSEMNDFINETLIKK